MSIKASEFQVVAEARRAVEGQMTFFNRMMATKAASGVAKKPMSEPPKKAVGTPKQK